MQISYDNKKLQTVCQEKAVAQKSLGVACARKLMLRLQAIEAAACVTDLVAGNPHPLAGSRYGEFALDLAHGWRLTIVSADNPAPINSDGAIDWSQVTTVIIKYIGNYHD